MLKQLCFLLMSLSFFSESSGQSYIPERNNHKMLVKPGVDLQAFGFPIQNVRLLNSPFKTAMDLDAAHLLEIEPDRLLNRFYINAGLQSKGEIYGGWESESISGHSLGHYLSACSMMYAASGDKRYKDKADYIVAELSLCQQARKTGYIGAIPKEDSIWHEVSLGNLETKLFSLNGTWSPWYVQHKIMAGLLDTYLYCDNDLALEVVVKFADWVVDLTKNLNDAQIQKMLFCEFGGMNESLVNTYAITGNQKYLSASFRFQHKAIVDSLAMGYDILTKKHSNTQIPKLLGSIRRYELTGNKADKKAAEFFYDIVVHKHTYATGGNSDGEYFGEANRMSERLTDHTTETCNTYNMLKLNRHLFCINPSSSYADYSERALYNHILASQNSLTGMVCYFTPLRAGGKRAYGSKFDAFWCCTGTGMENHVKYGENIYYESRDGNSLYINTFIPSELNWKHRNVKIRMETLYPYDNKISLIYLAEKSDVFTMLLRKPSWVDNIVTITVNGKIISKLSPVNGYYAIKRTWQNGDKIEMNLPLNLYTESMPDDKNRIVFKYCPLVLGGILNEKLKDPINGAPILLPGKKPEKMWLLPLDKKQLTFTTDIAYPAQYTLKPFNTLHDEHYMVYWDIFTPNEFNEHKKGMDAEIKRQQDIESATIDKIDFGDNISKDVHHFMGDKLEGSESFDRFLQSATRDGWLSFELNIADKNDQYLMLQHSGSEESRYHDIYVDDVKIASQWLNRDKPNRFIEFFYKVPNEIIRDKSKVKVRLKALSEKKSPGVFEARVLKNTF